MERRMMSGQDVATCPVLHIDTMYAFVIKVGEIIYFREDVIDKRKMEIIQDRRIAIFEYSICLFDVG